MSARNSWFLNSVILLLYYICGDIEYISAQPTGLRILHTLTHGFNIPPFRLSPYSIRFDGVNGAYMSVQVERHPWERHRFRHHHGYGPHEDFGNLGNAPPFALNPATGPFGAPRVSVAPTQDSVIATHPWHNPHNPHGNRHPPRWHDCRRPMVADPDLNGENVQGAGYEAGNFGQTAIFENTNNGIHEWENSGPPRRGGGEPKEDAVIDITPTTPTTTRAVPPTTTESAERTMDITEPTTKTYETTTVNNSGAISTTKTYETITEEITEPTTKTYETTTVNNSGAISTTKTYETATIEITEPTTKTYETSTANNSGAISTTGATVTAAPTESTFAIDIRGGFA